MATTEDIPGKMKAAAIDRFGEIDELHALEVDVPDLSPREVLIRVEVAGVGSWDPWLVGGGMPEGTGRFPAVFGSDGEGTIVAVGKAVKRYRAGDRVYGWGFGNKKGGFFAEYAAIPEDNIAPIPRGIAEDEAGALAAAGVTALNGLEALELSHGDDVVIIGASGGVGHIAVQLAKRLGARVFAVASEADGVALAHRLGADRAVDGKRGGIVDTAKGHAPEGFHGALVLAGKPDGWRDLLQLIKPQGRVAYPHGVEPLPKVDGAIGLRAFDAEQNAAALGRLNDLIGAEPFHVEIQRIYPIEQAAQALKDVEKHHLGKLAIRIH